MKEYDNEAENKFIREAEGKNIHSVYTRCYECKTWGICMPNDTVCGNCGSNDTMTFYDAETVRLLLKESYEKGSWEL